jgi:hypothetical protein
MEDRGDTSSAPASGSRYRPPLAGNIGEDLAWALGLTVVALGLPLGLQSAFGRRDHGGGDRHSATQPTSPSQANNLPRAFVGREDRDLGRVSRTQTYI